MADTQQILPDFMIIGAMKCATSTLHDQLSLQPGICMSNPKEPNFFSDDEQFAKGFGWYSKVFPCERADVIRGESSTHYTKWPTYPKTIERMKAVGVRPKFIYVMRHPVDRLVSHFIHEWTQGVVDGPIDDALKTLPEMVDYGLYSRQLKKYFDAFGQDSVLPVFFDRIRHSPQSELERIAHFIGYQGSPVWHVDRKPQNISKERIRRFPFSEVLLRSRPAVWLRRAIVPRRLRDVVKKRLTMRERPQLDDGLRRKLEEVFDADLAILGSWLGVELNCKNFSDVTGKQSLNWVSAD